MEKEKIAYPIIDLHQDLSLYVNFPEQRSSLDAAEQTGVEVLKSSNLKLVLATGFSDAEMGNSTTEDHFLQMKKDIYFYKQYFGLVSSFSDIEKSLEQSRTSLLFHIEGLDFVTDDSDLEKLNELHSNGLRSIGMAWNHDNKLVGGTLEGGSLTELGKKVIAWCLENNVVVDLAHMNNASFFQTAEILIEKKKPLFVSHGNTFSLCQNKRNYNDKQLEMIGESGGVIGVMFSNKFLKINENIPTQETVIEHVKKIIDTAGADSIGIGSDFGGILSGTPTGLNSISDLENLAYLFEKEFGNEIVEKIMYKNALRVLKEYLL